MKYLNKTGIACIIACAHAGLAMAAPPTAKDVEVRSVTVKYSLSEAHTPDGAKALYSKLRSAASDVCGSAREARGTQRWIIQECAASAVTAAVNDVNVAALDAIHNNQRGTVEVIASR